MGDGLGTALALLRDDAEPVSSEKQLGLLDDAEPDADLPLVERTPSASGGKGGRPKGRMNRSTEQWVSYIQRNHRSPLVVLAQTWSRPVADLARELQLYRYGSDGLPLKDADGQPLLNLAEAYKLQQSAAVNALPYLHSRMPQAIHVDGGKSAGVIVFGLGEAPAIEGDGLTLNLQDYQEVNEAAAEQSDDGKVG